MDIDELLTAVASLQVDIDNASVADANALIAKQLPATNDEDFVDLNGEAFGNFIMNKSPATLACACVNVLMACTSTREERGRADIDAKVKSLQARWFGQVSNNADTSENFMRGDIIQLNNEDYLVYSIFKSSYNKWRWVPTAAWSSRERCIVHARRVFVLAGTSVELMDHYPPVLFKGKRMRDAIRSRHGRVQSSCRC